MKYTPSVPKVLSYLPSKLLYLVDNNFRAKEVASSIIIIIVTYVNWNYLQNSFYCWQILHYPTLHKESHNLIHNSKFNQF